MSKSVHIPGNKRLCLFMGFIFLSILFISAFIPTDKASAANNLTDQDFFGVWNGSSWTTAGKLNYTYFPLVEVNVKAGDYAGAKTELLNYYRNRNTRVIPVPESSARSSAIADLTCDDIYTSAQTNTQYQGTVTVNDTYVYVECNVLTAVNEQLDTTKQLTLMLMGRYKESSVAEFFSREQTSNKPTLEVVINSTPYLLTANKDTYIDGGSNATHGPATTLLACDTGSPYNTSSRRAYINFDLSSLPTASSPTSATLKLYGRNQSAGNKVVAVFKQGDTSWSESAFNWTIANGDTFSWNGLSGGCTWSQPTSGADSQFDDIITRLFFLYTTAIEYAQTSDTKYSDAVVRIMVDYLTDKSAGHINNLCTGFRANSLVKAYHLIKGSSSLTASDNTEILKFIWQEGNWLRNNYDSGNNWGVTETLGLYSVAVYFPEFGNSPEWQSMANTRIESLSSTLNFSDGSYKEASSFYARVALKDFYNVKKFGEVNSQSFTAVFDTNLQKMGKYVMDISFLNGFDPQFGDSDYVNSAQSLLLNLGNTYNREEFKYFGSGGTQGTPPSYTSVNYPVGYNANMRTGWTNNDQYLNININAGNHSHPDGLGIIAYGYGRPLIVDPGRYTYDNDAIGNWLRNTTEAHSTIEINNAAQSDSGSKKLNKWLTNGLTDFYEAYYDGYTGFRHMRSVLFVRPTYWIVSDYVTAPTGTHNYKQGWHFLPDANISLDGATKKVSTAFASGANIQVVPADPSSLIASTPNGYYSPKYGAAATAKYATYVKNTSGNITFDTVLYPTNMGESRNVAVARLSTNPSVDTTVATAMRIDLNSGGSSNLGYYYLSHESSPATARSFDIYNYNGKAAYIETTSGGTLVSASMIAGQTLKQNTTNLVSHTTTVDDISIKWSGDGATLDIFSSCLYNNSDSESAVAIYAPFASAVNYNGSPVPYTKIGNYIYSVGTTRGGSTPIPTPTPITYNTIADAYINFGTADTNYGGTTPLLVKKNTVTPANNRIAYMKYDYTTASSILGAKLRFYVESVTAPYTVHVYGLNADSWTETGITWNNAPNNNTSGYGMTGTGVTDIGTVSVTNTGWYEIDCYGYISGQNDKIATLALLSDTSGGQLNCIITSREGTNVPQLVLQSERGY